MRGQVLTFDPSLVRKGDSQATLEEDQIGFKTAVKILNLWEFTDAEKAVVLGDFSVATFRRLKGGNLARKLTIDRRTRVSLILGVYKALMTLFIQDEHRLEWINNENRAFRGFSPKDVMLSGALLGLYEIRHYLDAVLA